MATLADYKTQVARLNACVERLDDVPPDGHPTDEQKAKLRKDIEGLIESDTEFVDLPTPVLDLLVDDEDFDRSVRSLRETADGAEAWLREWGV